MTAMTGKHFSNFICHSLLLVDEVCLIELKTLLRQTDFHCEIQKRRTDWDVVARSGSGESSSVR
jgi:hypothetical protein